MCFEDYMSDRDRAIQTVERPNISQNCYIYSANERMQVLPVIEYQ